MQIFLKKNKTKEKYFLDVNYTHTHTQDVVLYASVVQRFVLNPIILLRVWPSSQIECVVLYVF